MGVRAGQGAKGHSLPFDKAQGKKVMRFSPTASTKVISCTKNRVSSYLAGVRRWRKDGVGLRGGSISKGLKDPASESPRAMDGLTPPTAVRSFLFDGRIERRLSMQVPVYLARENEPRTGERVFTRNVSPHGVRLVTKQKWQPGGEPLITPHAGEFPQPAQVVYCHVRERGGFYVGLRFTGRSIKWAELPSG